MNPIIIAAVGLCGTGKSEVTRFITDDYGFHRIYFGGFIIDEVKARGLAVDSDNERVVREDLRRQHGMGVVAHLAGPALARSLAERANVVIDGLYSYAEYELLKARFGAALVLIAVHASRRVRYARMQARPVRPLTAQEVDARDHAEITRLDKGGPIALADFHIVNDGDMDELRAALGRIMAGIPGLQPR